MLLVLLLMMPPQADQCGTCHPEVRVQHRSSVHNQEAIGCVACHGGDPDTVSVERAHRGTFRRGLGRGQIPELCAECHADPRQMRVYNLPTDQYVLFQTSPHGLGLAKGDTRVAVCTDCHGTHDILRAENPESTTYVRNVPETCGRCHGDAGLMARYGKQARIPDLYLGSVHGRELMEKGNVNAPECSRCHGVHGAAPPGIGDVVKVCGSCHTAALRAFRSGPHAEALGEGGACVSCHDSHDVQQAVRANVSAVCSQCHDGDSTGLDVGSKITVLIRRAIEETEKAQQLIESAAQVPLYVDDYTARLEEARTHLLEAEPATHSVTLETVQGFTRPARSIGEEIQAEITGELSDLRIRRIGLVIFWFYLVVTLGILLRQRRKFMGESK